MPELRADRIATLYFFHPLQRLLRRTSAGIPILMYHSISRREEAGRSPYFRTQTDPSVFRDQIRFLASSGYRTIGLDEAVHRLETTPPDTEKVVVLTFDDGYGDFYTEAYPVLRAFRYTATVFLPTAYIGEFARQFNGMACLTWSQVRELQSAGIEFGSHTVTHPQLRTLTRDAVRRELRCSKQGMEDRLGVSVKSFSYPYAFPETDRAFKQGLREMLIEAGYQNGASTIIGSANRSNDRFFLNRLPVNSGDKIHLLRAKLEGGYDWLHAAQLAWKTWSACSNPTRRLNVDEM